MSTIDQTNRIPARAGKDAREWAAELHEAGLAYNIDEDPEECGFFSEEECTTLRDIVDQFTLDEHDECGDEIIILMQRDQMAEHSRGEGQA